MKYLSLMSLKPIHFYSGLLKHAHYLILLKYRTRVHRKLSESAAILCEDNTRFETDAE